MDKEIEGMAKDIDTVKEISQIAGIISRVLFGENDSNDIDLWNDVSRCAETIYSEGYRKCLDENGNNVSDLCIKCKQTLREEMAKELPLLSREG